LVSGPDGTKNGESINSLRKMILGDFDVQFTDHQRQPGKYLALDCEMVGVGIEGKESSLARVSLVNYYGVVQLDEFVRQRERVVDYRTEWSGVRETDMIKAKPFGDIQKQVADLLKDRILIGHAVYNDLKALLLSHSGPLTRDTQRYAYNHKVVKSRYTALRALVKQEFGIAIQGGEHSSVTDARATMAIYRLHRRQWEKGARMPPPIAEGSNAPSGKRKRETLERMEDLPGGGRKGISSGMSTVTTRPNTKHSSKAERKTADGKPHKAKTKWWTDLGSGTSAKGSVRLKLG